MKFFSPWAKKSMIGWNFIQFVFLSMTHDDPTSLKEVKEVEKKKWMESDGKIKGKKIYSSKKPSHRISN